MPAIQEMYKVIHKNIWQKLLELEIDGSNEQVIRVDVNDRLKITSLTLLIILYKRCKD